MPWPAPPNPRTNFVAEIQSQPAVFTTANDAEDKLTKDRKYLHCLLVEDLDPRVSTKDIVVTSRGHCSVDQHADNISLGFPVWAVQQPVATPTGRTEAKEKDLLPIREGSFQRENAVLVCGADRNFYVVELPQLLRHQNKAQDALITVQVLAQSSSPDKASAIDSTITGAAAGTITYSKLSDLQKTQFDEARHDESWGLVHISAVSVMSLKDSREFENNHPEAVLDSLWVDRWKPTDEGDIAKSRWCVVGWQDPDIHEIERSSPMPNDHTLNVGG